jgi:hypothetical protein
MSEQWELCNVSSSGGTQLIKSIYSPSGMQRSEYHPKEYADIVCGLLAEGWEPFHVGYTPIGFPPSTYVYYTYFRRRVS